MPFVTGYPYIEVTPDTTCKPVLITLCSPREGVDKLVTLLHAQLESCLSNKQVKCLPLSRDLEVSLHK